jgi:predicted transcriptional regulator
MTAQTPDIAEEVRAAIARRQAKQTDIALVIGRSQAGVSRRLDGKTEFTAVEIGQIAEFLQVPIGSLYREGVTA